jgi:hypothetical protein
VKRFLALLAVGAAVAAALAVPSGAVDTKGPPCADITFGDGSYIAPSLDWRVELAAPSCAFVTYTIYIYDVSGQTLLATETISGVSGETSLNFGHTLSGTNVPAVVCLVGETSIARHVADRAPDGECVPVTPDGSGGVGFQ